MPHLSLILLYVSFPYVPCMYVTFMSSWRRNGNFQVWKYLAKDMMDDDDALFHIKPIYHWRVLRKYPLLNNFMEISTISFHQKMLCASHPLMKQKICYPHEVVQLWDLSMKNFNGWINSSWNLVIFMFHLVFLHDISKPWRLHILFS